MCETCSAIEKFTVGGDADVAILALPNGTAVAAARAHKRLTQLAKPVQERLFNIANDVSVLLYEALAAHGTNIIGEDTDHARYVIVSRTENDGIELKWEPKRVAPKDIQELGKKISDEAWSIGKRDSTERENPVIEHRAPAPLKAEPETVPVKKPELSTPEMKPPGEHNAGDHDLGDIAADIQRTVKRGPTEETDYRIRNLTRRR